MVAVLRASFRSLRRDWRSGELRVIGLALMIAVAAVTAVGFFTDRVDRAMRSQASELLAADLVVEAPDPVRAALREEVARRGLDTADTVSFPSVVLHRDLSSLVEVKAVSETYPLRGRMRIAMCWRSAAAAWSSPRS